MGAYVAFLDLALGIANPALGYIADAFGMSKIFIISAITVLFSAFIVAFLLKKQKFAIARHKILQKPQIIFSELGDFVAGEMGNIRPS
ncbi:hypothetical protein [Draconibacterium orientale]|uniref:hypothetical protein n=1 Tax=Draconibacterium orientale TaxID=1168034 RepID=UPI0029C097C3|nr:hypothetical protein [Draconibacterium orientale]